MDDQHQGTDKPYHRTIRSFVRREGRMTPRQQQALETLWSRFGVDVPAGELDFVSLFGRDGPVVIEIGFGMGQSLLNLALANPQNNYLGIEVHRPGVGSLLAGLVEHTLSNVRVIMADAKEILQRQVPAASLEGVLLFFPDPWPKLRHQKRRLVQPEFVDLVASKLMAGGTFHMATDWENYAEQMLRVASNCQQLDNTAGAGQFTPRPDTRPLTKFERRGQKLGHGVWDLLFVKR
jgi:tRNA (guanine-N7-)-methyltransferase